MKTALIISLNFHPGHVSHLVASYKQCQEIGYEPIYFVNPEFRDYLPSRQRITYSTDTLPECDLAIFLFPSLYNLRSICKLKKHGTKIVYIFHEPLAPLRHYRESGFSYMYLAKLWVIDHVSALTVKWSDIVLLPSNKAIKYYNENPLYQNKNAHYMPLMYDDEYDESYHRSKRYISYIGTIAADHSFDEFLSFIEAALVNGWFMEKKFLIATKSDFKIPEYLQSSSRVIIQKGRPLTDKEINEAYAESLIVWNAYIRTTQSGVLAKSYMFGTPAIVLRQNLNEFMIEDKTVVVIEDNSDVNQIKGAIATVLHNQQHYNSECRNLFLNTFYYRKFNKRFKYIIE